MRSGGWKPFWAALFASLLVLVPLVGGTVLLSRQQLRTQLRQAARSESGVLIQLPKTTDQLTVLLCVSGEQPGFVLAYLNASQNCVHLLSVPAVLTVPFAEEETSLARCYAAAGPARCREALAQVLALPEGTRYLAFSSAVLERISNRYGPVRVGFTGALTEEELAPMVAAGPCRAFPPGTRTNSCASCRPTKPFHPYAPQRPALPCGMRFSGRIWTCCPPPCRMPCVPAVRPCSPT